MKKSFSCSNKWWSVKLLFAFLVSMCSAQSLYAYDCETDCTYHDLNTSSSYTSSNTSLTSLSSNTKSAQVKEVYLVHEDQKNGELGLTIRVSFNIEGCLNENCDIVTLFYNRVSGVQLSKTSSGYRYDNKWLCTFKNFKPSYNNSAYTKLEMFIPYSAFEVPNGVYGFQAEFLIRDNTHVLVKSGRYNFNLMKIDYQCPSCGGNGECSICHGTGVWRTSNYYARLRWPSAYVGIPSSTTCRTCGGHKKCFNCGGKKILSRSKSMDDDSEYNTNEPSVPTQPSYNSNSNGAIKTKTNRNKCYGCNGNGKRKVPIAVTWTEANARVCEECGEYMKHSGHFHQICSTCGGLGYTETTEVVYD